MSFALQAEQKESYDCWYPAWSQGEISLEERTLLGFMNGQRVNEVHRTGAELTVSAMVIPMEQFMREVSLRGWQMYLQSGVPGTPYPDQLGTARTFPTLGDRDVISAC